MAKHAGGARQPLSQRKPGRVARAVSKTRALTAEPSKASGKRPTGAPPGKKFAAKGQLQVARRNAAVPEKRRKKRPARPDPQTIWAHLIALYPDAHCELDFQTPWELLVATILSAQCTDKRVNLVTPVLFARYRGPGELADANPADVEEIIRSTGFFRAKARSIIGAANALVERHGGAVPDRMEELVVLPGVGRKTANVVLGNAYGINEGVVVDTHVGRLATRLALSRQTDPIKVEMDLMAIFPRDRWTLLSHLLIWHGRRICDARRPRCEICPLNSICPSSLV